MAHLRKEAKYRRRRLVALVALALVLSFVAFCVYSLSYGAYAVARQFAGHSVSRAAVPAARPQAQVKYCDAQDVRVALVPRSAVMPLGGVMDFQVTLTHVGQDSCLLDAVTRLTVTAGADAAEQVYRSDQCGAPHKFLLMAQGDSDTESLQWHGERSSDQCSPDVQPRQLDRGSYTARVALRAHPNQPQPVDPSRVARSQPIAIAIR